MAGGNAIVARLGLDNKDLQRDLTSSEKLVIGASNNMASAANKSTGLQLAGTGRVKKQLAGLTETILSGGSAYDILTQGALRFANSFRLGLGVAAGVAIAAVAYKEIKGAIDEAIAAQKDLRKEVERPLIAGQSAGGVQGEIAQITEKQEALKKAHGLIAKIGDAFTGKSGRADRADDEASQRKIALGKELVDRVQEEIAARRQALETSQRQSELLEVQLKTREKLAGLDADQKLNPNVRTAQKAQAQGEADAESLAINRKFDAKERELDLEQKLNTIKSIGRDVDVESAKARFEAAGRELAAAHDVESRREADEKQRTARQDLVQAQRAAAALKGQQDLAQRLAAAPEGQRRRLELEGDRSNLQEQLKAQLPDSDEARKIGVQIAENAASLREETIAEAVRRNAAAKSNIEANTGDTGADQFKALQSKIALQAGQVSILQSLGASPEQLATARAELRGLGNEYAKILKQQSQGAKEAGEQTKILQLRSNHEDAIAEALQTQLDFQKKIAEAKKAGDTATAAELKNQAAITLQKNAQDLATRNSDKGKATLGELAKNAFNQQGAAAREAERLEARAETERKRGHVGAALDLQGRADRIKGGIGALKSTEKVLSQSDVSKAIDSAGLAKSLKAIADNLFTAQ